MTNNEQITQSEADRFYQENNLTKGVKVIGFQPTLFLAPYDVRTRINALKLVVSSKVLRIKDLRCKLYRPYPNKHYVLSKIPIYVNLDLALWLLDEPIDLNYEWLMPDGRVIRHELSVLCHDGVPIQGKPLVCDDYLYNVGDNSLKKDKFQSRTLYDFYQDGARIDDHLIKKALEDYGSITGYDLDGQGNCLLKENVECEYKKRESWEHLWSFD